MEFRGGSVELSKVKISEVKKNAGKHVRTHVTGKMSEVKI